MAIAAIQYKKYKKFLSLHTGDIFSNYSVTTKKCTCTNCSTENVITDDQTEFTCTNCNTLNTITAEKTTSTTKWFYGLKANTEKVPNDFDKFYNKEKITSVQFAESETVDTPSDTIKLNSATANNKPASINFGTSADSNEIYFSMSTDKSKIILKSDKDVNLLSNYDTEELLNTAKTAASIVDTDKFYLNFYLFINADSSLVYDATSETAKYYKTEYTLWKNDGSNLNKKATIGAESDPVTFASINQSIDSTMNTRANDGNYDYTLAGISFDVNGTVLDSFEVANFSFWYNTINMYCIWTKTEHVIKTVKITAHKNNGSDTTEVVNFTDDHNTDIDDITYIKIIDALSTNIKTRSADSSYTYELKGISTSQNGDIINLTSHKFTEDTDIYLIWDKTEILPVSNTVDYIKAGKLKIINDILFVLPEDSEIVQKIAYCNNFYYILCKNNKIYKLVITETSSVIVNILDLSGYNTVVENNDIVSTDTVLIIKAGDYILTDKETVKNNFGINDSTLSVTVDSTTSKLNTKTVVKINVK